jgi:hypothetical protein
LGDVGIDMRIILIWMLNRGWTGFKLLGIESSWLVNTVMNLVCHKRRKVS